VRENTCPVSDAVDQQLLHPRQQSGDVVSFDLLKALPAGMLYINVCVFLKSFLSTTVVIPSDLDNPSFLWLVAWHSGRTSVSDRRTFAVLRSTCG